MKIEHLNAVIEHLDRLTLQQQQLTQQIAKLQIEIQGRRQAIVQPGNNDTPKQEIPVKREPGNNTRIRPIRVGDWVSIKNPGKNQPNTGTIHSYTSSRLFVRIKLDNCDRIVNRAPRNVTRIKSCRPASTTTLPHH
jgi:hypothetical protein